MVIGLPGVAASGERSNRAIRAGPVVGDVALVGVALSAALVAVGSVTVAVGRVAVGDAGVLVGEPLLEESTVNVAPALSPASPRATTERGPAGAVLES